MLQASVDMESFIQLHCYQAMTFCGQNSPGKTNAQLSAGKVSSLLIVEEQQEGKLYKNSLELKIKDCTYFYILKYL